MDSRPSILHEPLSRAVWRLALPAMGAMLLRYTNHAVDQFWIGRLDQAADSLAAISAGNFVIWMIYAQAALFGTGLQALVARAVGARDPLEQARAMQHGVALALLLGLLVAVAGLVGKGWLLRFQELQPAVNTLAGGYLAIIFLGLPVSYVGMAFDTIYRAEGDTLTPFRVGLVAVVVNTLLAPVLIRGWGAIPRLGIHGAALVTVGVQTIQMLILAHLHRRRERPAAVRVEVAQLGRLVRLGLPVALSGTLFSFIYVALVKVLSPYGSAPVAALGLGHTIEGFPHFLCVGFAAAAATLVGQNLGAGRPAQAERAAWAVLRYLLLLLAPIALLYGVFAPQLLRCFMNPPDPEVIRYGTQYLRMAAAVQLCGGVEVVLFQALVGAGWTVAPTAVNLGVLALRVPLAILLARTCGLGPLGVWLSIGAMTSLFAGLMTALFRWGRWKTRII